VLEVFGVYLAGGVLVTLAVHLVGITVQNPLSRVTAGITDAELLTLSLELLALLALQYAGWFALAGPIDWWHRRRGPSAYGLTRAGHSWKTLILAAVATAATLALYPPIDFLWTALGKHRDTTPWREAFFAMMNMSWHRWQFWVFSAVGSWLVIPIVEELFFRGYCQRRLAEDWGDGPAIVGTACLFAFSHSQYFRADAYNVGLLLGVFVSALGLGVVFALTRSLIPSILVHALADFPTSNRVEVVLLAMLVIGAVFSVRPAWAAIKKVFAGANAPACLGLAMLGIAYPIASKRVPTLAFVAMGMVLVAVALEFTDKKRAGSDRPPRTAT
jgi:membrane protease YdiL (CAAX protease family)